MAKRIGVLEADQRAEDTPRSHAKKTVAAVLVDRRFAIRIGQNLIQMTCLTYRAAKALVLETLRPPAPKILIVRYFCEGPIGVGNALPFATQSDGDRLHYETPHAGDKGLWRHHRKRIRVSSRKIAFAVAMQLKARLA